MEARIDWNADPSVAEGLEREVGWPRAGGEVQRRFLIDPDGHFVARDASGQVVGGVSCVAYRGGLAWVGGMVVRPEVRGRGLARALLRVGLAHAEGRGAGIVGLDATDQGAPLYASEGFHAAGRSPRWRRTRPDAAEIPDAGPLAVYPLSSAEVRDVGRYDAPRFGADRSAWLAHVVADVPGRAFVAFDRPTGGVAGFVLGQERCVGPLVADSPAAARWLLHAAEAAGTPPNACLIDANPQAAPVFHAAGWEPEGVSMLRMTRGGPLPGRPDTVYAVGAWALG